MTEDERLGNPPILERCVNCTKANDGVDNNIPIPPHEQQKLKDKGHTFAEIKYDSKGVIMEGNMKVITKNIME